MLSADYINPPLDAEVLPPAKSTGPKKQKRWQLGFAHRYLHWEYNKKL